MTPRPSLLGDEAIRSELMKLCREVNRVDDQLGQRSDHEGQEDGPTFSLWGNGEVFFAHVCERQIELHAEAILVWKKLRKLNRKRFKK